MATPQNQTKQPQATTDSDDDDKFSIGSPGVTRIEVISSKFSILNRIFFFLGIFLVAYVYGLDGQVRLTYQTMATSSFGQHSLLSTVNVLRAVIAVAAQPTAAKIADIFGRVELILISVVLYVVGTVVETASNTTSTFSGGAILYQIGYTALVLLVEVLIADVTSLRTRLIFSYIPGLPFLINTWISGNVTSAVLAHSTWRWGVGMFAIIMPVCAIPLLVTLFIGHLRAKKSGVGAYKTSILGQGLTLCETVSQIFWYLDIVGILLLIAWLALILVPFTIAGSTAEQWKQAKIIAPLAVGVACVPVWVLWERSCKHPMVPFRLLKDRAVWGALGIALMLNTAWAMQGEYLFTVLRVSFNESVMSATRISSLYSFCSVITGCVVGLIVLKVRRLKWFIVAGTSLFMVAFGLLFYFRGGTRAASHSGVIGAQVLLGIAGGLFPYPAQASIQAATKHEHLAVVTAIYLALYNVGSAIGNTIAGAIWRQVLLGKLTTQFGDSTFASKAFGDPFTFIADHPVGTLARERAIIAYRQTQRLLCITGICLTVPLIVFSLVIRDPKLGDEQSDPKAEKEDEGADEGA